MLYRGILPMIYNYNIDYLLAADHIYANRCLIEQKTDFHAHNFIEIAYVASGQGEHIIDDHIYPVSSGDITVINYDVPHAFKRTGQSLLIYNCVFTPVFLDFMLSDSRSLLDVCNHFLLGHFYQGNLEKAVTVHASGNENIHIQSIYMKILEELDGKKIGYREITRSYLIDLLITIFRLSQDSPQRPKLSEVIDYINLHFKEQIPISTLAKIACFSQSTFCRKFKQVAGMTVTAFIQTLRMEEACKLLLSTEQKVELIANEVGYHDMKHFYDVFKRVTGKLPADYRRNAE